MTKATLSCSQLVEFFTISKLFLTQHKMNLFESSEKKWPQTSYVYLLPCTSAGLEPSKAVRHRTPVGHLKHNNTRGPENHHCAYQTAKLRAGYSLNSTYQNPNKQNRESSRHVPCTSSVPHSTENPSENFRKSFSQKQGTEYVLLSLLHWFLKRRT